MASSQDDIVDSLQSPTGIRERYKDIETLVRDVDVSSLPDVDRVFSLLDDILEESTSLKVRCLGFGFLGQIFQRQETSPERRIQCIRALTRPTSSENFIYQIAALKAALETSTISDVETNLFLDYLINSIVPRFEATKSSRERLRSEVKTSSKDLLPEEKGLNDLFEIIISCVRRSPSQIYETRAYALLNNALYVVEKASQTATVEQVCLLVQSIIVVAAVPSSILNRCVQDLCAIYSTTQRLQDLTRECFLFLLADNTIYEDAVLKAILGSASNPPLERASYTACGALKVIRLIITRQSDPSMSRLGLHLVLETINSVDLSSRSICKEVLRTALLVLTTEKFLEQGTGDFDWRPLFRAIRDASRYFSPNSQQKRLLVNDQIDSQVRDSDEPSTGLAIYLADALAKQWNQSHASYKGLISQYFAETRQSLPDGYIENFLSTLDQEGHFSFQTNGWRTNLIQVVELFFFQNDSTPEVRCSVAKVFRSCLNSSLPGEDRAYIHQLIIRLLHAFPTMKALLLANALAELLVIELGMAQAPLEHTQESMELIWPLITTFEKATPVPGSSANTVVRAIVKLFIQTMDQNPLKAIIVFNVLVSVAQSRELPPSSRLASFNLLVRLRGDKVCKLLVLSDPDHQGLPSTIYRAEGVSSKLHDRDTEPSLLDKSDSRNGRTSGLSVKLPAAARNTPRPTARSDRPLKTRAPLWLHPEISGLPIIPPQPGNTKLQVYTQGMKKASWIHVGEWLVTVIGVLQQPASDWDVYSYVIAHLPAQLSNRQLFRGSMPHIGMLRRIVVDQLLDGNVHEPPVDTGVRKGDVALCLFHSLMMLVGYSDNIERKEQERIVHAFYQGIGEWERTAQYCIQSLTICCYVLPTAVIPRLSAILQKMSQVITQSHLTVDILEFLAGLARLHNMYINFREEEFRTVFAICVRYLEHSREQRTRLLTGADIASTPSSQKNEAVALPTAPEKPDLYEDLPQYVFALAYQVITAWFLSVKISNRNDHVGWITKNLSWFDEAGNEIMEEQSQVTLDMMLRTSYLNLGETEPGDPFTEIDGPVVTKIWLLGLSIVTIETAAFTGISRLTKRQASGTTYATYRPQTRNLPPHHEPLYQDGQISGLGISIFPNHVLLQLTSSIAPVPAPLEAICLPEDDSVKRAISVFDRYDTVDGYKVGVIYVANGQIDERSILSNKCGSASFDFFLEGLGTKVSLKGANFNSQGLDRSEDLDGTHTYAWRDRITEIIYHVPTMMPTNLETDPYFINKKKHVGNDYVNIIWNESGLPFKFETIPSQFNCVNIVIVPDACFSPSAQESGFQPQQDSESGAGDFYTIQMLTSAGFPSLSPVAKYKLLPLKTLPLLTRQLALQASVFSNVWMNRDTGEHASSWRNRLREIKRMRERFANTGTSTSTKFPGAKSSKRYSQGDTFNGTVTMGGLAEKDEELAASLDFSRWAGPNAPSLGLR